MKAKTTTIARIILGLIFFIFGLNGFFNFLPSPALPESAMGFIGGLASSGYFFPVLKGTEVLMGLLLITGVAAPLALVVLAPITIHILLFHAILTPGLSNSALPLVMVLLHIVSAVAYWKNFKPLFSSENSLISKSNSGQALHIGNLA